MLNYYYIFIFCHFFALCFSFYQSICSGRNYRSCCTDYFKDVQSGSCKPCIGSFGHNCSFPCPNGYYGHGCRYKCDCNDTQTCEPQIGCLAKNNGQKNSLLKTIHVHVAVIVSCFLAVPDIGSSFG